MLRLVCGASNSRQNFGLGVGPPGDTLNLGRGLGWNFRSASALRRTRVWTWARTGRFGPGWEWV
jgi:hypothetical protein